MSRFSIRNPYLIVVVCLIVVGHRDHLRRAHAGRSLSRHQHSAGGRGHLLQRDAAGADRNRHHRQFERFFTLGSGIDHMESRSLPGVSIIKVFFQPGTNADSDVNTISNLAMADLRRLPPGTLPPIVLKFDASSLPVCLVTLKGEGLTETQLRDLGQYTVRNQLAGVPGASVPQPFGGKYRQIMVYVDPDEAGRVSVEPDGRGAGGQQRQPDPAGGRREDRPVRLRPLHQQPVPERHGHQPHSDQDGRATRRSLCGDIGHAEDANQIQNNIVRVDGQPSVYLPVMKQGGDTNTIAVVDGVKDAWSTADRRAASS